MGHVATVEWRAYGRGEHVVRLPPSLARGKAGLQLSPAWEGTTAVDLTERARQTVKAMEEYVYQDCMAKGRLDLLDPTIPALAGQRSGGRPGP